MKRVVVFINGILNRAGSHDGWTDRAVTWTHTATEHRAEKWEYTAGALTRRFLQASRAAKIATMLGYYERAGFELVLVGHSNGCDIIARVLRLRGAEPWYFDSPVRSVHLIAPAADESDLEHAIAGGDLLRLYIYGSANDRALKLGGLSRSLLGWAGLGYGTLGLAVRPLADFPNVFVHRNDAYGHSTWFDRGLPFETTMQLLYNHALQS